MATPIPSTPDAAVAATATSGAPTSEEKQEEEEQPVPPPVRPRALIVVGDGSEEMEVLTLSDILALGGMHVTLGALGRKPMNIVEGSFGMRIHADKSIEESSYGTFELIVLPGVRTLSVLDPTVGRLICSFSMLQGPGAEHYCDSELLKKMMSWHKQDGRWLAASSNAPARVLHPLGLLQGQATCSPDCKHLMPECYVDARVVVSGNVVTSKGPGTAIQFALTLVKLLYSEDEASRIASNLCFPWP